MADWRERLRSIFREDIAREESGAGERPGLKRRSSNEFIEEVAVPAFEELREELRNYGREAVIELGHGMASVTLVHEGEEEFSYAIRLRSFKKMTFAFPEIEEEPDSADQRNVAEVLVNGDPQERRPTERFRKEEIIEDFLELCSKWITW